MVTFTSVEGKKGYHQCEELEDALRFVERLRNHEGVSDAQIFHMEEIAIEVKQYYRVEVANGVAMPPPPPAPDAFAVEMPVEHPMEPMAPVMPDALHAEPSRPSFSIFSKG